MHLGLIVRVPSDKRRLLLGWIGGEREVQVVNDEAGEERRDWILRQKPCDAHGGWGWGRGQSSRSLLAAHTREHSKGQGRPKQCARQRDECRVGSDFPAETKSRIKSSGR